jgi:polysaccharide export outer membrane protein
MRTHSLKRFILFFLISGPFLHSQIDPEVLSVLSKLSPDQKQQLMKQYGSGEKNLPQPEPSVELPNHDVIIEQAGRESLEDGTNFLEHLDLMEKMISADILDLQSQVEEFEISQDNELLGALEQSKSLLRKINGLQRREIEKRAEDFAKSEIDSIKPFGYDLFVSDPSTFAPGNEVPIPSDYRIGPGDLIEIQLFGQRNDTFSLRISREGLIRFPGIGPINPFEKGTSFLALKNHLKEKIREHLGEGVQSSITLGAFRSIRIFLLGEVRKQGAYTVSALSTTINALLSCGGIKESGSLRKIQLKRAGKVISTLDLYDLLLRGDTSADKALQPGDVIFVPVVHNQITISGAVKRPAKYEILGGETLSDAIELSGGAANRSVLDFIRLERLNSDYRPIVKNLKFVDHQKFLISSGDLISIGFANSSIKNVVSLIGAVEKVGDFEWKEGLQLQDLINTSDDFLTNTDLQYGIIRRKHMDGTFSCLSFKPQDLVFGESPPIRLQSNDLIYFFKRDNKSRGELLSGLLSDLRSQTFSGSFAKVTKVTGAVHFPGEYPLTDNMSLSDLLCASGGTKDSAYTVDAEISRVIINPQQKASVEHISIEKNTLVDGNSSSKFKIYPYDTLTIKPIPLWREGESITLKGEFNFPGTYSLKNGETLIEVIERAGGLTERAFPNGAIFSRENLRKKEDEQKERLIAQLESDLATATLSATDPKDAMQAEAAANVMLTRLRNSESQGRLVIDLGGLLAKNGDVLIVPQIPYSVSVSGEVQFPSSHLYEKTFVLDDYLNRSGGFTQNADKKRTFVVKANGSVMSKGGNAWFANGKSDHHIEAGDVIVVPIDVKQTKFLETLSSSTQIIYQLAVAAAAVNSF